MKQNFLFAAFVTVFLFFSPSLLQAQEKAPRSEKKEKNYLTIVEKEEKSLKVRPFRIGLKIGAPNLIGGNLEYVLPLLGKRFAVNADYSNLKSDWLLEGDESGEESNDQLDFTYLDLGLNFYLFKPGKGLYAGVSYSTINVDASTPFEDGTDYVEEEHSSINVKLGARLGGLFYFRPEIGYSFDPLPETYEVRTVYNDGTEEIETQGWESEGTPAELLFKGLMFNIGIGFAF